MHKKAHKCVKYMRIFLFPSENGQRVKTDEIEKSSMWMLHTHADNTILRRIVYIVTYYVNFV